MDDRLALESKVTQTAKCNEKGLYISVAIQPLFERHLFENSAEEVEYYNLSLSYI
jgi:hypothetical protein